MPPLSPDIDRFDHEPRRQMSCYQRQHRQTAHRAPPQTAGDRHAQRADRRLEHEERQRMVLAAALPAQMTLPQVTKVTPTDGMQTRTPSHPHGKPAAPDG